MDLVGAMSSPFIVDIAVLKIIMIFPILLPVHQSASLDKSEQKVVENFAEKLKSLKAVSFSCHENEACVRHLFKP
jgi:hypothetical protein